MSLPYKLLDLFFFAGEFSFSESKLTIESIISDLCQDYGTLSRHNIGKLNYLPLILFLGHRNPLDS